VNRCHATPNIRRVHSSFRHILFPAPKPTALYKICLLLGGIDESDNAAYTIATDVTTAARGPSVCVSITLVHSAKAVGWNEMPFGRDTHVVPSNIVLARGPGLTERGDLEVVADYGHITLAFIIMIIIIIDMKIYI